MHQHVHTGIVAFVYVTVAAIVGINAVRLGAAWLANRPSTEAAGKAIGGLVHWGA